MEAPSTHGHRGGVPRQGVLLAVLFLTFWTPPTTANITIEFLPHEAAEGMNVLLLVRDLAGSPDSYVWYKGGVPTPSQLIGSHEVATAVTIQGHAHSGRETIYPNGSMLIQNVTQEDTGLYTLLAIRSKSIAEVAKRLSIHYAISKPNIRSNSSNPVEDKDTVELTCEPETPNTTYLWSINNQSLSDSPRLQLSKDNRTLTILHVTRKDTGSYVCDTRNPVSASRSEPFTLNVLYGPDTPTISSLDPYYHPGELLNLSCHAASNPPAQYSWLINGTPQDYTHQLVIPNVTERDSGSYACLAHNSATGLNSTTVGTVTVYTSEALPSVQASNTTVTEDKDQVVLTCLTRVTGTATLWFLNKQILWLTDRMMLSRDHRSLTINPVRREDAGDYQCVVWSPNGSSKSNPITLTVTAGDTTGLSAGVTAAIVIGVLAGGVLAVALGCVLIRRKSERASDKCVLTEHWPPASTFDSGPSGNSTYLALESNLKPAIPIYQELLHCDMNIYCQIIHKAEAAL